MALSIKKYLEKIIKKHISLLKEEIMYLETALGFLEDLNAKKATYYVRLRSLWTDHGGKSIKVTVENTSMKNAIIFAEEKYKEQNPNNVSSLQAEYSLQIVLGENYITIPENYWEKYKQENRES